MKLSVVIPALNEEKRIRSVLSSLQNQKRKPDEIIVVDNNSTDKTREIVTTEFPNVRLLSAKVKGAAHARHVGFLASTGDVICRTDADCWVPENWVQNIELFFQSHPRCVGLTGLITYQEPPIRWVGGFPSMVASYIDVLILKHHPLFGPNCAVSAQAYRKSHPCLGDRCHIGDLHEDVDMGQHILPYGDIHFSSSINVFSSARRILSRPYEFFIVYPAMFYNHLYRHPELQKEKTS